MHCLDTIIAVQVRLPDGTRLAGRFNPSQTVGDLRRCAWQCTLGQSSTLAVKLLCEQVMFM